MVAGAPLRWHCRMTRMTRPAAAPWTPMIAALLPARRLLEPTHAVTMCSLSAP